MNKTQPQSKQQPAANKGQEAKKPNPAPSKPGKK